MEANVFGLIRAETRGLSGRTALVESSRSVTYERLLNDAETFAGVLRRRGVAPGSRVALLCPDGIDYVVASLALLAVPAVVVPLPPASAGPELDAAAERMDVAFLLDARDAAPGAPGDSLRLPGEDAREVRLVARRTAGALPPEADRLGAAFVRFSSGTTGASKGVLLSHATIAARTDAADAGLAITSDDTVLWVLSMSYHFVVSILLFLRRGATIVVCGQPIVESMRRGLVDLGATVTYASPFHYQLATASDAVPPGAFDRVRLPVSTAMGLPRRAAVRFEAKFGRRLAGAYGIIEVGLPFVDADPAGRRTGTVGRRLPAYEAAIDGPDAEGNGEILVRGPGMFDAYVSPFRRRDEVLADGWFRTGDVGRIDADGYLHIAGRRKGVINFAGMKVFPEEVEEVIDSHPDVVESLVRGEAHPTFGELPAAQVVLRPGAARAAAPHGIREWCRARLEPHKVPAVVEVVASLPRTASDKILRR